jgi:hypothetical protein
MSLPYFWPPEPASKAKMKRLKNNVSPSSLADDDPSNLDWSGKKTV